MANHAKVCTGNTLDPKEVNQLVQDINEDRFGNIFFIEFDEKEKTWYLSETVETNQWIGLSFWISDEIDFTKTGKKKVISKQNCIEFRHGHAYNLMWYIEGVFREALGEHYKARMWDDGVGWIEEGPDVKRFESFKKYKNGYMSDLDKEELKEIPKNIIKKLELKF